MMAGPRRRRARHAVEPFLRRPLPEDVLAAAKLEADNKPPGAERVRCPGGDGAPAGVWSGPGTSLDEDPASSASVATTLTTRRTSMTTDRAPAPGFVPTATPSLVDPRHAYPSPDPSTALRAIRTERHPRRRAGHPRGPGR